MQPENPADLAQKISLLANDKSLRSEMSINCRKLALEQFNWKNIINDWQKQIKSISNNEKPYIEGLES